MTWGSDVEHSAMQILCPHCKKSYEVESQKEAISDVPGISVEEAGQRLRVSWWRHNLPLDLRWLGALLMLVVLAVARSWMPSLQVIKLGALPAIWALFVASGAGAALWGLFRTFFQKRIIAADSLYLRSWSEPLGFDALQLNTRNVRQLYVSRSGQLRCRGLGKEHTVLATGRPVQMRYVEQLVEERLSLADEEVTGEWRAPDWILPEWRTCPHCHQVMQTMEISRQLEPVALPNGLELEKSERQLRLSYSWRGPILVFLTLWLLIWDGVCSVFVMAGIAAAMKGNLAGLGVFFIPHIWIGIAMTYFYVTLLFNRTTVFCDQDRLKVSHGPLPWFGQRDLDARDIEQLFVVTHRGKNTSYTLEARLKSGQTVRILGNTPRGQLEFIEQEVEAFLGITNTE